MHKLYLNIFFVCSLIYGLETINISLDPISHNTFYLNSTHPVYQSDLLNKEYVVEGNLGSAMSVYYLEDLYTNTNDSIRTTSSFLYKQGDVGYRDFTFAIKTKASNTGILKLAGNSLSYPGRLAQYGNSNILQNYLLSFSKQINSSKAISFYMAYHLENTDTQYINSNSGESYLLGINYDISKENYEFRVKYASQTGQTNFSNPINYHIRWSMINFNYRITDRIELYIDNKYKDFYLNRNKYNTNNLSAGFLTDFSLTNFNTSLSLVESVLYPQISLETKFNHLNIDIGLDHGNWFDCSQYASNNYQYYFSNISYKSDSIEIELEPRYIQYDNNSYWSLTNRVIMDFNIINSKTLIIPFLLSLNKTKLSVSFQNNYYNTSDLIIKNYTHLSFKLFESESDRRYKNFLGLSYKGIQFNSRHSINLNEMGLYSNEIDWPWNDNRMKNYLDFHIGLEFEKFIFSWHFTNILSENYLINSSGNIENLNMQYFTVKWKFDN